MSLSQAAGLFAGIHENAINDVLRAFARQRPRYFAYGSPGFVPATSVAETQMGAIPFPGVAGGIEWRIRLGLPQIDLFKQTLPLPPELTLQPGGFSAQLGVELCLDCRQLKIDPNPPPDFNPDRPPPDQRPNDNPHPVRELTCAKLRVFAVGHLERVLSVGGEEAIAFGIDRVEIVDIAPAEVETLLECFLFMILQAVFASIRLPLSALRIGAFSLNITQGPLIEDDEIRVRGNF